MIRGWCPTVHTPMPTGDGLLARVKPFGGHLPAPLLRALAQAAARYGNGVLELTSHGNLQVRGLHDPAAFARAMVVAGLADPDPEREARRNVISVPPCDPALVAAAEAAMAATAGLPAKACVVVRGERAWLGGQWLGGAGELGARLAQFSAAPGPLPLAAAPVEGCLLHLPFGQTSAAELARLAGQVAAVRTTPWRALLSPVQVPGFAAAPSTMAACAGAPACAKATTPTRTDAARLEAMGFAGLHVSGCSKGCAHRSRATTLVARGGRYDLVRHGYAGDPPALTGLTLEQAAAAL